MLKNDLEKYQTEDLVLDNILIHTIPNKQRKEFVDPYSADYDGASMDGGEYTQTLNASQPVSNAPNTANKSQEDMSVP